MAADQLGLSLKMLHSCNEITCFTEGKKKHWENTKGESAAALTYIVEEDGTACPQGGP